MKISLIAAASSNLAIGIDGGMPWHLPADLRHFKEITMGHHILMGRKTWELFPKPLPGRTSLVLSSKIQDLPTGVFGFRDLASAIDHAKQNGENELMVIGGGQIYEAALPLAQTLYLTRIFTRVPNATAWFPPVKGNEWKIIQSDFFPKDEKNDFSMEFMTLERL